MVAVNVPFNFFLLLSILCFVHSFRIQYQSNSGPLQLGRKFGLDQRSKHVVSPSHQHPSLQKQAFLKNYDYMNKRTSPSHIYTTFLSNQLNENDESNPLSMKETDQILIGGAGTLAAIVTLYSEFVLKTTGCGLPAGPFGLVGAIEGISYLAIVGIVAYALFIKVKTVSIFVSPQLEYFYQMF